MLHSQPDAFSLGDFHDSTAALEKGKTRRCVIYAREGEKTAVVG